ncbi:uncharacterized protein [Onthophagus taurus]|uniref:uncharacterized protein n=1 Tax=Onthophagus taurus TaxID=166361 RepID=UPI0039BDCD24
MENLSNNPTINANIKSAPAHAIKALNRLIFEYDGDRRNRQRLREFQGFSFDEDSDDFNNKLKYIKENLTLKDLVACCCVLHVDFDSVTVDEIPKKVCMTLSDLNKLASSMKATEEHEKSNSGDKSNEEMQENDDTDDNNGDDNEGTDDDENVDERRSCGSRTTPKTTNKKKTKTYEDDLCMTTKFMMTFRDVEDTIL